MNIYTVGQINAYIKNMFSQDYFLQSVVVAGEVSNVTHHSSGHIYFTLKDETGILSAVMFRSNAAKMSWTLQKGDRIEAAGSVNIYEKNSDYQLYVKSIKKAGEGAAHEALEKLKKRLEEKGMFSDTYKQPIPRYSFRIGVVTSPTGSVIHDIRQVAARRNPAVEIILQSAIVQGESAPQSIIAGIKALETKGVDVIIIGRGGGSEEDLSAFNNEDLANAIFNCAIPIVSAVGHGDDESITDLVADAHAPTPSAAAELTVFLYEEFVRDVNMRLMSMENMMRRRIERSYSALSQRKLRMDALSPQSKVRLQKMEYAARLERLESLMRKKLDSSRHRMSIYLEKYRALSPLEKIGHGFAAVTDEAGRKITDAAKVSPGDRLRLTMREGLIEATAERVVKRES